MGAIELSIEATPGQDYYFRSRAVDRAGNEEAWPVAPDYDTVVTAGADSSGLGRVHLPLVEKEYGGP